MAKAFAPNEEVAQPGTPTAKGNSFAVLKQLKSPTEYGLGRGMRAFALPILVALMGSSISSLSLTAWCWWSS